MNKKLKKLSRFLEKENIDAALISSVSNIVYLTDYSGFSYFEREAFLLILKNKKYIITDGRYSEAVATHIPHFELIEISPQTSMKKLLERLIKKHAIKKIGIEEKNITVFEKEKILPHLNDIYHLSNGISNLRSIKTPSEISAIEQACKLGDKTFEYVLDYISKVRPSRRSHLSEREVAFQIEHFIKKNNGELSFPSIVAFGKNSSVPHHQSGNAKLKPNSIVLLDFGVKLNNYCSDMTRTVFFGKANTEQKRMYQTVLDAQKKAIELLNHGIKASAVDKIARDCIIKQNYPSIPHSLGHGIGIEVHEQPSLSPKSQDELKTGMVFSIEPGIYIPGFGGVRIEDLVVLENSGPKLLTQSPKELIEL